MAFKKVVLTKEEEEALKGGNYFKFVVGTKMLGKFVKTQEQTGQFKKVGCLDYVFRIAVRDEATGKPIPGQSEEIVVNTAKNLNALLEKCDLKPNHLVKITCTGEIEIGQPNKMKTYEVEFDDAPPSNKAAAPPPPPPPAAGDDDIPF